MRVESNVSIASITVQRECVCYSIRPTAFFGTSSYLGSPADSEDINEAPPLPGAVLRHQVQSGVLLFVFRVLPSPSSVSDSVNSCVLRLVHVAVHTISRVPAPEEGSTYMLCFMCV